MFERLGRFVYRRRRWVLAVAAVFVIGSAVWGTKVFSRLDAGGFEDRGSDSYRAEQTVDAELGRNQADVIVLYRSATGTVDDPGYERGVKTVVAGLPREVVKRAVTYWDARAAHLVSADRHATYVVLGLREDDDHDRHKELNKIEDRLRAPGLETRVGGLTAIDRDINERVAHDLGRAETISLPILLVMLVVIFGGLVAAQLPLAIGVIAILGSFAALRALTYVTDVSVYSIQAVTILGLGLAIDYGLFMVTRFREEIARTPTVEDAVARTMATAGRTVAVSGITVAISLAGLLIFPLVFLRSMGLGGIAAVLIAMLAALLLLPAALGMLGPRVDALAIRRRRRRAPARPPQPTAPDPGAPGSGAIAADRPGTDRPGGDRPGAGGVRDEAVATGVWYRIARSVMRRPVTYAVVVVIVLGAMGLPFLRVEFGGVDHRVLPADTESRQVSEAINRDFTRNAASPIQVVLTLPGDAAGAAGRQAVDQYLGSVRAVPGVTGATAAGNAGNTVRVDVSYTADPIAGEARQLVQRIRDVPAPPGVQVLVGGRAAELADLLAGIGRGLPWMALIISVTTFVLLFLAFGSLLLPVKAIVMNVLSLGASYGALVWIFQEGHLSGVLGFTPTGTLDATQPILVLAIVFGLSMDYEVFLMSRIREQYDLIGDNTAAVATGLQRTGRIITSAALLLIVVTAAFSMSGITFIKLIGVAMVLAILVDATVVRTLLVPATMRLLGRANWWAPAPLRTLYRRYGIHEAS